VLASHGAVRIIRVRETAIHYNVAKTAVNAKMVSRVRVRVVHTGVVSIIVNIRRPSRRAR
jgi:hypothetical protein